MALSSASRSDPGYGLLNSDCRLAAMARSLIRTARSLMYEMKFGLIGFAIGTMAITGVSLASAPKQPAPAVVAAQPTQATDMLWPELAEKSHRD
jgi:hypothetical protein